MFYQRHRIRRDAFFTASEAELLGCGGLDRDIVPISLHHLRKAILHRLNVRIELWLLGTYRAVYIAHLISLRSDELYRLPKQYLGVNAIGFYGSIREVVPDIPHIRCPKESVANSMYQHVSITMAQQTVCMLYLYSTQPQVATFYKLVDIISHSYSYHLFVFVIVFVTIEHTLLIIHAIGTLMARVMKNLGQYDRWYACCRGLRTYST